MSDFQDKVIFITGAASGIGLATSHYFAERGARLFCCDINQEALKRAVDELNLNSTNATEHVFDVSDATQCQTAIEKCIDTYGQLDVLCNVAGMTQIKRFEDISVEDFTRIMSVNSSSVFYLSKFAMPHLLSSKGNIVNIASTAGIAGLPYNAGYCASKGAAVLLSKALAVEYANQGVRVNVVCPGAVNTPINKNVAPPKDADMALMKRMYPLTPYFAEASEVAEAVGYLASVSARFVTGTVLTIDGGQTAV